MNFANTNPKANVSRVHDLAPLKKSQKNINENTFFFFFSKAQDHTFLQLFYCQYE